jgi:hypothetical protein
MRPGSKSNPHLFLVPRLIMRGAYLHSLIHFHGLIIKLRDNYIKNKQTPWPQSASELYLPSDRRLSAKLEPTFADRGCRVVSATVPHGRILGSLDRSRYYFFQVAPQLYSPGWVYPVPDPLLLRKSGGTGNRTRDLWICSQELWPLDHRGVLTIISSFFFLSALPPNSGLGRLHETFRLISVTRSRTVGRTPWAGDQLVARPLPVHKHRKTHHNTNT